MREIYPPGARKAPPRDSADFNRDGVFDWHDLEVETERVRLLEDCDGDGRADRSTVFAEGFNSLTTGVGAGILARGNDLFLFPNAKIAPGFESVLVTMKGGKSYGGVLKSESATQLVIHSPEDGVLTLKKADIQARDRSLSAMPEGVTNILSRQDLRNLVEFLAATSQPQARSGDGR